MAHITSMPAQIDASIDNKPLVLPEPERDRHGKQRKPNQTNVSPSE